MADLPSTLSPQEHQADWLTNLLAIFTWIGVALMGWPHLSQDRQGIGLALFLLFGLLLIGSLVVPLHRRVTHLYLTAQTLVIVFLMLSSPGNWQIPAILFFVLSSEVMALLPSRQGYLWIALFTLASGLAFIRMGSWPDGLLALLPFAGGYFFFGAFTYAWAAADAARQESQHLLAELQKAHQQLRDYANRVEALTIAQERARLARELHDSLGHALTALDVQMELLVRLPPQQTEARQQAADRARSLVKQALADLRQGVQALRPTAVDSFSLPEAGAALVAEFSADTHLPIEWQVVGSESPLPPALALALYRTAQEGLTNIQRHAATTPGVRVQVIYQPQEVSMTVENAPPVELPDLPKPGCGYGLLGLRERAEALGGSLEAAPTPGGGFHLTLRLPLSTPTDSP